MSSRIQSSSSPQRSSRSRSKRQAASLRPISVLPEVYEEDEALTSPVSGSSQYLTVGAYDKAGKRSSRPRPTGFIGKEELGPAALVLPQSPLNAASQPSPSSPPGDESAELTSVTLSMDGMILDFPQPPSASSSPARPSTMRRHEHVSPALSSTSMSTTSSGSPITPVSSDEEFTLPPVAPLSLSKGRYRSGSVSQVFAPLDSIGIQELDLSLQSMLKEVKAEVMGEEEEPIVDAPEKVEQEQEQEQEQEEKAGEESGESDYESDDCDEPQWIDVDEDDMRDYYRSDMATHLQLYSSNSWSISASRRSSHCSLYTAPARPDSMLPPPMPRRRSSASSLTSVASNSSNHSRKSKKGPRRSKVSPATPTAPTPSIFLPEGPASELDPTFPRRTRRSFVIPNRPPPPIPAFPTTPLPPTPSTGGSNVLSIPVLDRPPPRSSLPTDVEFSNPFGEDDDEDNAAFARASHTIAFQFDEEEVDPFTPSPISSTFADAQRQLLPQTPLTPYTPPSPPREQTPTFPRTPAFPQTPITPDLFTPSSPTTTDFTEATDASIVPDRSLRSRWSTSTLGSVVEPERPRSRFAWFTKSNRSSKESKPKPPKPQSPAKEQLRPILSGTPVPVTRTYMIPPHLASPNSPSAKSRSSYSGSRSSTSSPTFGLQRQDSQRSVDSLSSISVTSSRGRGLPSSPSPSRMVRRQTSRMSTSSDRSAESASSTDSNGLRRKAIPVELFMRT